MSNTKIVLNRQSDLILDNAQITAPVGIVKADIPELVGDLSNLVAADAAEASARVAGDASLEAKHNAEMSTEVAARIAGDAAIQAEVDALEVEHAADVSTAAANLAAEASRAQAAEASNAAALAAEIAATDADFAAMDAAYKSADASMETKHDAEMSAETFARVAGDDVNAAAIATEKGRIDAILSASVADADTFAEIVTLINSVDTENDQAFAAYVLANNAAVSTEVARAGAAEASLEAALAAEIAATDADLASLEVKHDAEMSAEASTRVAVDAAQDAALSQEVVDRQAGDNAIQANLNNEISDRIANDQLQAANLTAEASRAAAAEASLATALAAEASVTDADFAAMDAAYKAADAAEASTRAAADAAEAAARAAAVTAEESARIAADNAEAAARLAADNSLEAKHDAEMSTEVAARIAGDAAEAAAREAAVSTETAAREAAISTEASAREFADNAEASSRAAADAVLQGNIDVETGRIDAILLASDADKDSFAEIVALINSVDTENDTAFAAYVLSNDAALSTEVARAESAEDDLQTNIVDLRDELNHNVKAAVGELDKKLFEEAELRAAGDAELDGKIADIISNTDITSMDSFSEVSAEIDAQVSGLEAADAELSAEISDSRETLEGYVINLGHALYSGITSAIPRMAGFDETPNGVNTTFTHYVYTGNIVFLNGLMQLEGVDYTITSANYNSEGTVTFTSAPAATDKINIYGVMGMFSEFDDNFNPSDLEGGFGSGGDKQGPILDPNKPDYTGGDVYGDNVAALTLYRGTLIFDTEVSKDSRITALAYDAENNLISGTHQRDTVMVMVRRDENDPNNLYSVDLSMYRTDAIVAKFEVLVDGVVYGEITESIIEMGGKHDKAEVGELIDGVILTGLTGATEKTVEP
jgi:hypothetical protein